MKLMKSPILMFWLLLTLAGSAAANRPLTLVEERPEAPAFTLPDMQGGTLSLADYRGKVLVVNFWATWCPPCRKEMPSLNRAAAWLKKYDVELIAINVGESADQVAKFLQQLTLDFPILLDQDTAVSTRWDATRLPITYVVDPQGRIAYRALGSREWDAPELLVPIRALGMSQ